jgi:nucleoside phosphorylase
VILLVAAAKDELGDLPGEPLGVGPVVPGVRMARLLERQRPTGVLFVGTGSAYPGGPAIGTACTARRIGLGDAVAQLGLGYVPRPPAAQLCDRRLVDRLLLPEYDVLSLGSVTTDLQLAARLADTWQVEHLESFAAAFACAEMDVPFAVVLGIVARAGPDAHAQWLTNRGAAREAAQAAVRPLLAGG